ncbi:MAG TPA: succinate dehydrogenase, cytochrome b556 subunit [Ktedonobacteraceae bacterium]|nr:succinate dehydrogenase, cytochrome b556 subunit [Ktedonobacteraceae bacterium]
MASLEYPKVRRATRWFDVRRRRLGMWAYALNRITGIGLVVYLYLHLVILSQLLGGAKSWDTFVSLARSPFFLTLDVVLIAGALIHGLNGLRVALMGFGIGLKVHKAFFVILMCVAVIALFVAALLIYGG